MGLRSGEMTGFVLVAVSVVALAITPLPAQQPAPLILGRPNGTVAQGFSRIASVAELPDGRVVLADSRDQLIHLIDFASRAASQLGRKGEGPNEYQSAFSVVRSPADTVYALDSRGTQFLRIDRNGVIAGGTRFQISTFAGGGVSPPRGVDTRGRVYMSATTVAEENGAFKRAIEMPIRRWNPSDNSLEVVATRADHSREMHAARFHPFAQRDEWIATPEGRVGVVVAADYHLRWFENGKVVSDGPPIPFEPIPVTAAERTAFRDERASAPAAGVRMVGGGDATAPAEVAARRRSMEEVYPDEYFPKFLPPIAEGGTVRAQSGDIWVTRSRAAADSIPSVDILDEGGRRKGSLKLPAGSRLLAVGQSAVYLARVDDDGLEWLERYSIPSSGR